MKTRPTKNNFVRLKILTLKEKRKIEAQLKEQFGIEEIYGLIIRRGKERLFLYTGDLSPKEITELEDSVIIERIGVYFAKIVENNNEQFIKLSIEGSQILKEQIKKNIFEMNEEQAEKWMKGQQLDIRVENKGLLIVKHKDDFMGNGKASQEKIGNYIPKSRRVRDSSN